MTDDDLKAAGVQKENGVVKSPVGIKTIAQGAATTVWCAVSPRLSDKGGVYCANCDISEIVSDESQLDAGVRRWAIDKPTAGALWELSEKLTDLKWPE